MNADLLLSALNQEIRESVSGQEAVAVAYSGGVDSSVIEAVARRHSATTCYACSLEGGFDAQNAQTRARDDGCYCVLLLISPDDLIMYVGNAARALGTTDPVAIGYTVPILCVLHRCKERAVLAGNGADELFGGYAKYLEMDSPAQAMATDLAKAQLEAQRIKEAAMSIHKQLVTPFLADQVIEIATAISLEEKINEARGKLVLRRIAMDLGLKSHDRAKKASQYSSGTMKMMRRMAKKDGLALDEWTAKVAEGSRRIP